MSGIFIHNKSVMEFAYQLVNEYDAWHRGQDKITRENNSKGKLKFNRGRWFSDDRIRHGMSTSTEYRAWSAMKQRCYNQNNKHYKDYGGRGISVCDEWMGSFISFFEAMGRKPRPDMSIDRIDNDGNYEPSNCRWATAREQYYNRNRR